MSKRAFIVHGWDGYPEEGWFPWLKHELETRGFKVHIPAMPDPRRPIIYAWVSRISAEVGIPDDQTFIIGHSIGAQAILRYLQTLGPTQRIGGVVFVAGWITLTSAAYEQTGDEETARPWLETPIDYGRVKLHVDHFSAIFSDNDPFVPLINIEAFRQKLNAEIAIEHGKGHFSGSDGVTELPIARDAVLKHAGTN